MICKMLQHIGSVYAINMCMYVYIYIGIYIYMYISVMCIYIYTHTYTSRYWAVPTPARFMPSELSWSITKQN